MGIRSAESAGLAGTWVAIVKLVLLLKAFGLVAPVAAQDAQIAAAVGRAAAISQVERSTEVTVSLATSVNSARASSGGWATLSLWNDQLNSRWHWTPEVMGGVLQSRHGDDSYRRTIVFAGGGLRLRYRRLVMASGLVITSGRTPALSTRHQFVSTLGLKLSRSLTLEYRHLSNASTGGHNGGEDLLTLSMTLPLKPHRDTATTVARQ